MGSRITTWLWLAPVTLVTVAAGYCRGEGFTLAEQLQAEGAERLAAAARISGDAQRGAVIFHQPYAACTRCHSVDGRAPALAPDLTSSQDPLSDVQIIESILEPSKSIRKGYETVTVVTSEGRTLAGVLAESTADQLKLWDASGGGAQITLPRTEIDEQALSEVSAMPAGLVNQLTSRQQFLDLTQYLSQIRDGGLARAQSLQPPPSSYALRIPEYEQHVDHAGMIRDLDGAALERGRAIYERVCMNCHGTAERPGSLPTSLRFASGTFKNGHDPLAIYRTLTHGFGQMTPQSWMVPQQKYDVIHYLRETYLRPFNPTQYAPVTAEYLAGLPVGDTRGPEPPSIEPWSAMDYGPTLTNTYEVGEDGTNFAYKGIAVRLDPGEGGVARGQNWMVFDHDTMRCAAAWSGTGFIDWNSVQFTGQHEVHPRVVGDVGVENPTGPGWANPRTERFDDDQRVVGRDGRRYGPLPRDWAQYRGLYHHGRRAIFAYRIGDADILEMPGAAPVSAESASPVFTRAFRILPHEDNLILLVATHTDDSPKLQVDGNQVVFGGEAQDSPHGSANSDRHALCAGLSVNAPGAAWHVDGQRLCLKIPASDVPVRFVLWMEAVERAFSDSVDRTAPALDDDAPDLDALAQGGPGRWREQLAAPATMGENNGPFAVDTLVHPEDNPWFAQLRFTGLDFFADQDRLAVCTWDGDVWEVRGLKQLATSATDQVGAATNQLHWRRIATGLFQPLGIKVIADVIHVTCRDQLVVLRDLNDDGEIDFYECLNNDHQVTEHFHEFAMGLQTDAAGDFYYAKSARHALKAIVPQHGTLLKVSRDGARTEILANGFRAANGVCLNPDGSFFVTDQEGHWNPKNRINWVTLSPSGKPKFYGNMFGYHDVTDPSDGRMERPLCWITNAFDRSPAELLWVASDKWGPLRGRLLNLSYGYGKAFVVPHEQLGDVIQGGMCQLPIPEFPTGIMRGRFHPGDGHLYVCGMFAWAGSATQPGGLYRIRATGQAMNLPVELNATKRGLAITFTEPLDRVQASMTANYRIKVWSLKRTENYGSEHYDTLSLNVSDASVSAEGRSVLLEIPEIQPTWCMEIGYSLRSAAGKDFHGVIHNTVHRLAE